MRRLLFWLFVAICLPPNLRATSITWSGTNGNLWDINTTTNWQNASTPDVFIQTDGVTFDDTSSNGSVTLAGSLQPSSVTINNNLTAYTFSGAGQISGATSLLKSGMGTLTISNTNSYTGGTVISAGTITVSTTNALSTSGTITLGDGNTGGNNVALLVNESGTGALNFGRPVIVSSSGSATATVGRTGAGAGLVTISSSMALNRNTTFQSSSSGTLSLTGVFSGSGNAIFTGGGVTSVTATSGTSAASWTGSVSVTGSSVVIASGTVSNLSAMSNNRNMSVAAGSGIGFAGTTGTYTLATLSGAGNVGTSGTASANIAVGGTSSLSSEFDGVIGGTTIDGNTLGTAVNLAKTGSGTFTMTGNNTYTGTTTISAGSLALTGAGSIGNSKSIVITSGAVLNVSGLSSGTFTLGSSQTLTAGRTSAPAFDIVGNLATSGTMNIAGSGTAGTLSVNGNLTLSGGKLLYDFASTSAGTSDQILVVGSLSLSGTTTIAPNLLGGSLASGTYTLISGTGGITSGSASNLVWGGTLNRQSVTFNTTTTPGSITMTVAGAAANLIWTGTNGNNWDVQTTTNWNNSGTADKFFAGDNVTFNDTSSNGNVTISGSLQPGSLIVNNNFTAYTFSGTGQIGGQTGLLKSGAGTLTISNTNSYTGGTIISAGTIAIGNGSALSTGTTTLGDVNTGTNNVGLLVNQSGTGAVTLSNSLVVSSLGSGTATIGRTGAGAALVTISSSMALSRNTIFQSASSGTLALTGVLSGSGNLLFTGGGVTSVSATSGTAASAWNGNVSVSGSSLVIASGSVPSTNLFSNNRNIDVAAGSGIAFTWGSGTYALGTLTDAGSVGATTGNANIAVGGSNASSTFSGAIGAATIDGVVMSGTVNLTKTGSGTFTMTGNDTSRGSVTVSQGTLALSGNGSIGSSLLPITITQGAVLNVSGLNSGTFSLGSSQTLQAGRTSGSAANDVVGNLASGGTVNVAGTGTVGTLTVSGNLTLTGGSLLLDFSNTTTPGTSDMISIGGSLSLSGTTTITPNLLSGTLAIGTYTLISGTGGITSGNASNLVWGGAASNQSITFNTTTTPGTITMTVSGTAGSNLVWTGTSGNAWDANTTANWNSSGTAAKFFNGNNVTFDDTSSNGTVTLTGSLQPGSVTVNNGATAYTFGGSGQINGATGLLKTGTGTLAISTTNNYTGGTVISSGTIQLNNPSGLGTGMTTLGDSNTGTNNVALLVQSGTGNQLNTYSGALTVSSLGSGTAIIGRTGTSSNPLIINSSFALNRDTTFQSSTSGTLIIWGTFSGSGNAIFSGGGATSISTSSGTGAANQWSGSVLVTGNTAAVFSGTSLLSNGRNVNVSAGSGIAMGSGTLGMLSGGGYLGNPGGGSGGTNNQNIAVGGSNASSTFDGVIGGATIAGYAIGSRVNLTKIGSGTLTLTGNNTYTGTTTVSQGTLALSGNGSISHSPLINVTSGAVLDVSGLSSGTFAVASGQTLQAGRTSGFASDVFGNLSTGSGTINIAGSGTAGTLTINGNIGLNGGDILYDLANNTTAGAHVNDLISATGGISLSGTTLVTVNLLTGTLASGTYTLISGTGIAAGSAANLAWGGPATRQIISFNTTAIPGDVLMTVSGSAANLVWSGSNGAVWDANSTAFSNTTNSGTAQFYGLDAVAFVDSGSNGTVVVSGSVEPASITVNNNSTAYTFSGSGQIAGATTLTKSGSGTLTITGTHTYTGTTTVSGGNLTVTGSLASAVTVSAGGSLAGYGTVGAISGSGTVAPGDPVIMTTSQVDPSGGLAFSFQFGQPGAPTYTNAAASGNDVVHITGATPFAFSLTSANKITLDFTGLILTQGETFYGGFFTDATIDPSAISGANFVYTGLNGATIDYEGLVTVPEADFASGTVYGGETMEFMVVAVPEPGTWALLGVGGMTLLFIKKRRVKKTG